MSYIGNAKTPLLLASNVRDDLIPDGVKREFELSQEVPGGYEENVIVVRRRFLDDTLIESTNLVEIVKSEVPGADSTITITDNYLAAAFSVITPESQNGAKDGDYLKIVYGADATQFSFNKVKSVSYNRDSITISLETSSTTTVPLQSISNTTIPKISRRYYGAWEILNASTQFEIKTKTDGTYKNQIIRIKDSVPAINDEIYVLHRGEATYNFVPSPYSVGPEQLTPNLRNCKIDSATYTSTGSKVLVLSQDVPSANTLIVTVNGIVQVSTNENKERNPSLTEEENLGTWTLSKDTNGTSIITLKQELFSSASAGTPVVVRVLHLSFSTIMRRASFSAGQEPTYIPDGTIISDKLASDSIQTRHIQNDKVTSSKILLTNNQALRSVKANGTDKLDLLKLDSSNRTVLFGEGVVDINFGATPSRALSIQPTSILPEVDASISLGSAEKKFSSVHTNTATVYGAATIKGNLTTEGNIQSTNISAIESKLQAFEQKLNSIKSNSVPVGTILIWAKSTVPNAAEFGGEWLPCEGQSLSTTDYATLHSVLGYAFGGTGANFNLPDLRSRFPFGASSSYSLATSDNVSSVSNRSPSHTHLGNQHKHTITHTHTVPAHKHTLDESSITINSSGSHSHDASHGHGSVTEKLTTDNTNLEHRHNIEHGHTLTQTESDDTQHIHQETTDNANTSHEHGLKVKLWTSSTNGGKYLTTGNTGAGVATLPTQLLQFDSASTNNDIVVGAGKSHKHTFDTGKAKLTDADWAAARLRDPRAANRENVKHSHNFSIPLGKVTTTTSPSGASGTPIVTSNTTSGVLGNLSHSHNFVIANTTVTTSTQTHTHGPTDFDSTGRIGPENGKNGNENIDTTTQSETYSGLGGNDSQTGPATVPHIALHFIIKVKGT